MAKYYTTSKLSEHISETPEGFLLCLSVPIARTGWMKYGPKECPLEAGDDGFVHVYRSAEQVFRPETVASFEGKDITVKHPEDFVDPDNWSTLSKGVAMNIRKAKEADDDGEESLLADFLIKEALTIKMVKAGLREVSCGYEAEYEQTGPGKGIQTNIVGNHIALVEEGRAGSTYAINDEKGNAMNAGLIERLKKKFGAKVIDEAMAEEKKEAKDEEAQSMDELVKSVKDLMSRVEGMCEQGKAKDEEKKDMPAKKDEKSEDEEKPAKDEDGAMEERLKALEAAVAKLLEKKSAQDEDMESEDDMEASEDDDMEEADDAVAEGEEGEESQKKKTGDSKAKRGVGLEGTKDVAAAKKYAKATDSSSKVMMTPEKMNELNAAHWAGKKE